jgi:guanine deaminase
MTSPRPSHASRVALRGDLVDFVSTPALDDLRTNAVRHRPDHWLLIDQGRIVGAQVHAPGPDWELIDQRGRLILPGFIDTHVHSAQLDVIGSWGTQLLDWLNTHTFPAEMRMADSEHAGAMSQMFIRALLEQGTTTACVFPSVHATSVDALMQSALDQGMRCIAGKVMMDRHAPAELCDTAETSESDSRALIARWHGVGRLSYAVTPRFAITSTPAQLDVAGRLLSDVPNLYVQTHVAENQQEVEWVRELFPQSRSYLDVYAAHGLVGPRSILAHGIWLDDRDLAVLRDQGSQIAFCPSSNLFLGSGLFNWPAACQAGVAVSLASDVGGGTSLSMRRTMLDAYKAQALQGHRISAFGLLHSCTRGAAKALQLADEIGTLEVGATADLCVWDWATTETGKRRQAVSRDLHERLFAWVTAADTSDLVQTWVAGKVRFAR